MIKIIIVAIILTLAYTHPTYYPQVDRNISCYEPTPAKILSYHIHLLFWTNGNSKSVDSAMKVRNDFISKFRADIHSDQCLDLFHQDYNCMFDIDHDAVGPFLTAQWAVFLLPEYLGKFLPWMMQNRGDNDILLHPNTGCEVEDHTWWTMWGGQEWQIDTSAFSHDQPFPWPTQEKKEQKLSQSQEQLLGLLNSIKH